VRQVSGCGKGVSFSTERPPCGELRAQCTKKKMGEPLAPLRGEEDAAGDPLPAKRVRPTHACQAELYVLNSGGETRGQARWGGGKHAEDCRPSKKKGRNDGGERVLGTHVEVRKGKDSYRRSRPTNIPGRSTVRFPPKKKGKDGKETAVQKECRPRRYARNQGNSLEVLLRKQDKQKSEVKVFEGRKWESFSNSKNPRRGGTRYRRGKRRQAVEGGEKGRQGSTLYREKKKKKRMNWKGRLSRPSIGAEKKRRQEGQKALEKMGKKGRSAPLSRERRGLNR